MSETKKLTPDEAIEKGFEYFNKYIKPHRKSHVLLEGLELDYDEKHWIVTIGFDIGREKVTSDAMRGLGSLLSDKTSEPIREISHIYINASDGSFVKLT